MVPLNVQNNYLPNLLNIGKCANLQSLFLFTYIDKCWASFTPNDISTTCKSRLLHAQVWNKILILHNHKDNKYDFP